MKLNIHDFGSIRASVVVFVLLVVAGAAAVAGSLYVSRQMQREHRLAVVQRSEIQAKLSRAREEEQEIRNKLKRYEELMARGYIGSENRLDWVDRIRAIKTARKLLDIEYELAPQRRLDEGAVGGYDFMSSNMRLQMQLLHEEDLTNFLADLHATVPAYLRVNSCNVERLQRTGQERGTVALLRADCSIDWITLREKK